MNENKIRILARMAANRSQFMSNHIYDHKSYEDGFCEGAKQILYKYNIINKLMRFLKHTLTK